MNNGIAAGQRRNRYAVSKPTGSGTEGSLFTANFRQLTQPLVRGGRIGGMNIPNLRYFPPAAEGNQTRRWAAVVVFVRPLGRSANSRTLLTGDVGHLCGD
jgi:hypothetical protein